MIIHYLSCDPARDNRISGVKCAVNQFLQIMVFAGADLYGVGVPDGKMTSITEVTDLRRIA